MADYTLQMPGEQVDKALSRAMQSAGTLRLDAGIGTSGSDYSITVTTPLADIKQRYASYVADPERYRWLLILTQNNALLEECAIDTLVTAAGLELHFTSKYSRRRYALKLQISGGDVTSVEPVLLADLDKSEEALDILAHSDCSLEQQVAQLRKMLLDIITGVLYIPKLSVKEMDVWGNNNLALTGPGAPKHAPDRAGQFYIDTTARVLYFSTGNEAVSDWKNA